MMAFLRVLAIVAGIAVAFSVGAARVPNQMRMPVPSVVPGGIVTQPFGCTTLELEPPAYWCPYHHFHTGVDLAAPQGTEVFSATSGTAMTGYDPAGAGNFVAVRVDQHTRILYCHLSAFAVHSGDAVEAGELIGRVGATGLATGPHVHLEIQIDGLPVDPEQWLAS